MDGESSADVCCVCLESLDQDGNGRQVLPCGHVLHELCVTEMRRHGGTGCCPMCRVECEDLAPVQAIIDQCSVLFIRKEYGVCHRKLSEALAIDPQNVRVNTMLGQLYLQGMGVERDVGLAIEYYHEAYRDGGADEMFNLGCAYQELGDLTKARELWEEARKLRHVGAIANLGVACQAKGHINKAIKLYEEARSLGDAGAVFNLAAALEEKGDMDRAMEMYEEACSLGHAGAMYNLGVHLKKQGDMLKAMVLWNEARLLGHTIALEIYEDALTHGVDFNEISRSLHSGVPESLSNDVDLNESSRSLHSGVPEEVSSDDVS